MATISSKLDELDRASTATLALLDEARLAGLDALHGLLDDEHGQAEFERARLIAKFGEDSEPSLDLEATLASAAQLQGGLRADAQALLTPPPEPPSEQTAHVIGRVTEASGLGVVGARVVAHSGEGKVVARATTDDAGAFALPLSTAEPISVQLEVSKRGEVLHQDGAAFRVATGETVWRHIPT